MMVELMVNDIEMIQLYNLCREGIRKDKIEQSLYKIQCIF